MTFTKGYFVTGTDTEVGKTLVSGALILKLREAGLVTLGFKPVAAGCYQDAQGKMFNEDIETLRLASSLESGQLELCPYLLERAAAPHLAAEEQQVQINLDTIANAYQQLSKYGEGVIVEGSGGFLIPINAKEDLGHLAQRLDLSITEILSLEG